MDGHLNDDILNFLVDLEKENEYDDQKAGNELREYMYGFVLVCCHLYWQVILTVENLVEVPT